MQKDFGEFEKKIGFKFKNKELLTQAFIHRSFINENPRNKIGHNERLEFLGDAILGLRRINSENNKVFFGMGLVVFLIGNVFYSRAYLTFSSYPKYIYFFIAMVITMILIVVLEFTKVNLGRFRICGYIYAYVSSFLFITVTMGMISKASVGMMLALLGVISFIISDFILGYLYFKKINPSKFKFYKYINIIAYYFGQVLIALSIYFLI